MAVLPDNVTIRIKTPLEFWEVRSIRDYYPDTEERVLIRFLVKGRAEAYCEAAERLEQRKRIVAADVKARAQRCFAVVDSPKLQWVRTPGGKHGGGREHHIKRTNRAWRDALEQLIGERHPHDTEYEVRGPFKVIR